jgi:ferric-dicitrate binding protein FerR (iron transport regulator)
VPVKLDPETRADRHRLHRRSFVCASGVALALAALRGAKAQTTEPAGMIEEVKGEGFAESRAARRTLERDSPVFVADLVGTGAASRLLLRLGEQTRVRLGERARIIIDRYLVNAGGEFTLEAGAMHFDRPSGKPAPVRIRSPYGLIAVRGTRFFAGPSAGVFGVFVERGTVSVMAAGREVVLLMGQGTDIPQPGEKPTTARRWRDLRIREALESVF